MSTCAFDANRAAQLRRAFTHADQAVPATSFDEAIETFLEEERPGMTLKRRGTAEEVASAIVFLCSERASFINGADIRVDSGSVMTVAG